MVNFRRFDDLSSNIVDKYIIVIYMKFGTQERCMVQS